MNIRLLAAALLCLTLMGCGQAPAAPTLPNRLTPTKETENDTLRCYPIDSPECRFFALGADLCMVQARDGQTVIRTFQGKNLTEATAVTLDGTEYTVTAAGSRVCCYGYGTCLIFSRELTLLHRIPMPDTVIGAPILSTDETQLYYCDAAGLRTINPDDSIHRLIRQMSEAAAVPVGFMGNSDSIVCNTDSGSLYLRAEDGALFGQSPPVMASCAIGSRDILAIRCGEADCLFLETGLLPLPPGASFLAFLPHSHSALIACNGVLQIHDLNTGNRTAALPFDGIPTQAVELEDGRIFLFLPGKNSGTLYQWIPPLEPARDRHIALTPVYTADSPNREGLAQCRQRASYIETKYGISILLNTDAVQPHLEGLRAEPEHLCPILAESLDAMESALSRLPTEFVRTILQHIGPTTVCLVRSIRENEQSTSYAQRWDDRHSYIYLVPSAHLEEDLFRCLMAMADSLVTLECDAYDTWEQSDAFSDECSERIALFLTAMSSDRREVFHSAILQNKLRTLCTALRRVFPLEGIECPWEQYLWDS